VHHGEFDHTSVLKLIEWRWNLAPLTSRNAAARNLATALDFASPPNSSAPRYSVPNAAGFPCTRISPNEVSHWQALGDQARSQGWSVTV
jgi:phospholipase C